MTLHTLRPNISKKKKRVGRGNASGHGTYSGRGGKGQTARTGGKRRPGFEGGQTPYVQKMPKLRGFKNPNHVEYQPVNIGQLNIFEDGTIVNKELLLSKGLVSKKSLPVKLLAGKGDLEKSLTIQVDKASKAAIEKIEAQKGKVELKAVKEPRVKKQYGEAK